MKSTHYAFVLVISKQLNVHQKTTYVGQVVAFALLEWCFQIRSARRRGRLVPKLDASFTQKPVNEMMMSKCKFLARR